jgi:hypothetical protein
LKSLFVLVSGCTQGGRPPVKTARPEPANKNNQRRRPNICIDGIEFHYDDINATATTTGPLFGQYEQTGQNYCDQGVVLTGQPSCANLQWPRIKKRPKGTSDWIHSLKQQQHRHACYDDKRFAMLTLWPGPALVALALALYILLFIYLLSKVTYFAVEPPAKK